MYNEFRETRNCFREYLNYSKPLSFEEWSSKPQDQKAAILFVQFFDQITLAWKNVNRGFNKQVACDGVEETIQYLMKNVPIIEAAPAKFSPAYIYRIIFNCLDCITWPEYWRSRVYNSEQSNIISHDGEELDLFDLIVNNNGDDEILESILCTDDMKECIWKVIEDMGVDTVKVVAKILGDRTNPLKVNASGKYGEFGKETLDNISDEKVAEVLSNLKDRFVSLGLSMA